VDLLRSCKRRFPHEYKRILIGNGHFHSMAHFMFCVIEGYWKCCLCTFAQWLHKKKDIVESMKDLQHDNAKHALDFHRVCTSAIIAFLLLDVKHPSPDLLMRDPQHYLSLIRHDGGIVIMQYLLNAGIPVLHWQRSIRKSDGREITKCLGSAFHSFRSLAHKTKSVYITLISLVGLVCAHPKLQALLEATCCISFLGRTFIAFDRFIEYINLLQQKRGTAFRGFDSQLQFSQYLKTLVHVDAAWKEADGNGTGIDDGIPKYLENDTAQLRRKLVEVIGTDLMGASRGNPLWHTGAPVPLDGGDYRERMPWEWEERVWNGGTVGKGRSDERRRSWREWLRVFLREHMFRM
jgi:hypothetical protein